MKIDGIEYFVTLFFGDMNGEQIEEMNFHDFHEMNNFIRNNKNVPEYMGCELTYTLSESVNGQPDSFSWTKPIAFQEFSDEDILEEIEAQKEWLKEIEAFGEKMDARIKEINYVEDNVDYTRKIPRLKEFTYVCPQCIREIEDCRCEFYPYYLVQIDKEILPVIRELNIKGYKTTGCCAGHPRENDSNSAMVYICFDRDYEFNEPLPEGARYSKEKHGIEFVTKTSSLAEMFEFQRETIWKLSDWAGMLFDYEEQEEDEDYGENI